MPLQRTPCRSLIYNLITGTLPPELFARNPQLRRLWVSGQRPQYARTAAGQGVHAPTVASTQRALALRLRCAVRSLGVPHRRRPCPFQQEDAGLKGRTVLPAAASFVSC